MLAIHFIYFIKQRFFAARNRHHLTLGRSGGQTVDTRSTSGVAPKSLGYNGSNELLGRSVASKLSPQHAGKKKRERQWNFVKNGNFLVFGLQLENEKRYRDGSNG